jgi:hypothetical protein
MFKQSVNVFVTTSKKAENVSLVMFHDFQECIRATNSCCKSTQQQQEAFQKVLKSLHRVYMENLKKLFAAHMRFGSAVKDYCTTRGFREFYEKPIAFARDKITILFKETVAQDFLASVFLWICSKWASDIEAKRIFFSFSFLRSYSNISMNPHCRLLRGFKNIFLRIPKLMVNFYRYQVLLFTT